MYAKIINTTQNLLWFYIINLGHIKQIIFLNIIFKIDVFMLFLRYLSINWEHYYLLFNDVILLWIALLKSKKLVSM